MTILGVKMMIIKPRSVPAHYLANSWHEYGERKP